MSAEPESVAYGCAGKSRIGGVVRARTIAKRMHRRYSEVYHVYWCRGCGFYHVGRDDGQMRARRGAES